MKMTKRKVFSIVMASIALFLFINMFIPYFKVGSTKINLWNDSFKGDRVIILLSLLSIMAIYLLHLFLNLKEKIVGYANYAVGFVTLYHIASFFARTDYLYVGMWLGIIASIGLVTISVIWNFMDDKPFGGNSGKKITGYDPKTGKPIYAEPKGFDPQTGKPIYE